MISSKDLYTEGIRPIGLAILVNLRYRSPLQVEQARLPPVHILPLLRGIVRPSIMYRPTLGVQSGL